MTKKERTDRKEIVKIRKSLASIKKEYKNLSPKQRAERLSEVRASISELENKILATANEVQVETKKAPAKKVVKRKNGLKI